MLSVLICFQHTTTIIRVNPSKNNSTESQNLPAIPQITPTINSIFPSTAKAQPPKRVYPLYLWPRSKVWMRALKASIQTAATKVTNIGGRLVCIPSSRQLKKYKIFVLPGWISGNIFMPPIVAFHEIPLVLRLQVLSVAGRLYSNLYIL